MNVVISNKKSQYYPLVRRVYVAAGESDRILDEVVGGFVGEVSVYDVYRALVHILMTYPSTMSAEGARVLWGDEFEKLTAGRFRLYAKSSARLPGEVEGE